MPVFSATAIQISGTSTPSRSRVTIDCFTGPVFQKMRVVSSGSPRNTCSHISLDPSEPANDVSMAIRLFQVYQLDFLHRMVRPVCQRVTTDNLYLHGTANFIALL